MNATTIFTVGHSTRAIGEFIRIVKAHEIQTLFDVQTVSEFRIDSK